MSNIKKELLNELNLIIDNFERDTKQDYESLKKWLKKLFITDVEDSYKIDLLEYAKPVFLNLQHCCDEYYQKVFFNLIANNQFKEAVKFSKYLVYEYPEYRENIRSIIKQRDIFLLSPKLDMEMGGLGHIVRHKANYLAENGYKVTFINCGPIKNYKYIVNHYKNTNQLNKNIKFYNYIEYYCIKNSNGSFNPTLNDIIGINQNSIEKNDERIEKTYNSDNSITLTYFKNNDEFKSELYIDECKVFEQTLEWEYYYTQDGFKYFEIDRNKHQFYLHNRDSGLTLEFGYRNQFLNHFLNEICFKNEKPFIICDSHNHWFNINSIKLKDAFKIGAIHGNPFIDYDPKNGLNPKVNSFKKINSFDKIVILTESLKVELIDAGVNREYLTVIPNFVLDEIIDKENSQKDFNKIGIFSRISPQKRLNHLIKAFNIIAENHKNAHIDIYGEVSILKDKKELKMLKDLIKKYNLNNQINFKGYIEDVHSEMEKSLFSVLTSGMEGFSVSTLELMANSTPIISYDIRYGPSDLISNNIDGILLEENDIEGLAKSMSYLLNNPEKAIEMGKLGKSKIANEFSRNKVCQMWEDLFIDIFIKKEVKDATNNADAEFKLKRFKKKNSKLINNNTDLKSKINTLKEENTKLKQSNNEILNSKSWRITEPLRKLK